MQRAAFKMRLKAGAAAEYQKRHAAIWPELVAELKAAVISSYSIFLDEETDTLFAVQNVEDNNSVHELADSLFVRKWLSYMTPLVEVHADNSPVTGPLREVFHLA
jgi:L-rhamnose mutarotase